MEEIESVMRARGFREKTIKSYNGIFKNFERFSRKKISESNEDNVISYLANLQRRGYSNVGLNVVISALKFGFGVYGKKLDLKRPKKERKLPSVLSKEEVNKIINSTKNIKHKLILRTIYGLGLRVSEIVNLKPEHVEFDRKMVLIKDSKGAKDRYVMLPRLLSKDLKNYISLNVGKYIFEGRNGKITIKTIQKIFENALKKSGISKKASCHTLRHSFATHLLENGISIRHIQKLLGHNKLETTQIYTHVANTDIVKIKSPLDNL